MRLSARVTAVCMSAVMLFTAGFPAFPAHADDSIAHDPSRDVNAVGVGNPFHFGERNTPADASIEEIRAINHKMTVQEVKYALYKEIDEHWELLKVRLGQRDREKVYALFLGVGTRESTLGGNGDGADIETAFSEGFGVSSAHAYGTLQTAVTAFRDPGTEFMQEEDVPELEWYDLTKENFYDAIISNHMGIRKILHFARSAMVEYNMTGWQVVRHALKGHNTGWAYEDPSEGYYKGYPDEICALAQWYYEEGHLYDNVFTWTDAPVAAAYRTGKQWETWWYDTDPSLEEVTEQPPEPPEITTPPVQTTSAPVQTTTEPPETSLPRNITHLGDVDCDGDVTVADAVLLARYIAEDKEVTVKAQGLLNAHCFADSGSLINADDLTAILEVCANLIREKDLPKRP